MQSISRVSTSSSIVAGNDSFPPLRQKAKDFVVNAPRGSAESLGPAVPCGAGRGRAGAGLDPSQTSVPNTSPNAFFVDARAMKVKRARYATLTAARLHKLERPTWSATFIGFTYRPGCDYGPRHISNMVGCLRDWCDKHGIECRYLWVAEMQKRGVIHYHMIVFHPKALQFPKPDKQGWWPHGSTSRSTGIRHAVAYMAKYMSKGDVASFPKGARTYGCGGLQGTAKLEMRWWKLPTWVREQVEPTDRAKRVLGGFLMPDSGELLPSPWQVSFRGGLVFVQRR
jgi:hypothetical protein